MSKVVSLGLSDHNLVYIVRKLYRPKVPPKVITFRSMKQFNEKSFQDDMEKLDWNECLNSDDIVTAWSTWKVNFLRVCDKHTPLVTRRVRGNKTKWVTDEYISLTHLRDRLKKRAEKQNTNSIWSQYRSVRNYVNNLRTTLKSRYYHDSVIENQRNHKQLWNVLKELNPGKKDNRSKISGLKVNDNVDTDKEHIANELNGFFVSIGASINSKQTVNSSNMKDYIPDLPACNFEFTEVNEEYVLKELKKLQTGKATGFDMVSAQLLKAAAPVICKHLTYLFNLSLISSELPSDWKQAKVSPIHKGGDRTDKNNYRPISVISVVMKILERIVHDQLQQHFVKYNLLAPQQSGFRKGHSTDTVLSYFSDYLLKHMDQGNLTGVVFLDFRKAFDSVNHHVLLQKLQMYGVRGAALVWFKNYLEDRKQKTVIDGTESDWGKIDTGVPQGSILGPLLFSIMVNDLPHVVHKCKIMLYADDAVLFYSSPYPDEIEETLNTELQNVYKWVNDNGLALNLLKTQFMLFGSSNNLLKITNPIALSVDGYQLTQVDSYKYLGVWLDPTLNWKEQIRCSSKKIGARIARLGRVKKYLPLSSLKLLANSLIMPLFEYCSIAWSSCPKNVKDVLIKQHKKLARVVAGADLRTPTQQVLQQLHWVQLEDRWNYQKCKMVFHALSEYSPTYLSDMFVRSQALHSYRTRNAMNMGLTIPKARTQMGKSRFSHDGAILWNRLPNAVKQASSKQSFASLYWKSG